MANVTKAPLSPKDMTRFMDLTFFWNVEHFALHSSSHILHKL